MFLSDLFWVKATVFYESESNKIKLVQYMASALATYWVR